MDGLAGGVSISLAPLLVVYFLLRVFNKKVKPIYTAARERLGDVSTRLQENLSGVVVIKIFGREKQEAERFEQATDAYYQRADPGDQRPQPVLPVHARGRVLQQHLHDRRRRISSSLHGGIQPGGFTPGKLLAFRAYWWRLFGPVQTLARVNDMVQRRRRAGRRVFEVLDAPDELPDAADARPVEQRARRRWSCDDVVSFRLSPADDASTATAGSPRRCCTTSSHPTSSRARRSRCAGPAGRARARC